MSHLSPGDGTRLGSCSVAAHRGEYFEVAHSLFRLRECNEVTIYSAWATVFSLLLTSILGLMTYWWVFGQTARNSFSGAQTSSPTLRLWAQSCDGACGQWMNYMCLSSTEGPSSLWKSWIPSVSRSWGWVCTIAFGSDVIKTTSCSEGSLEGSRRWQSWSTITLVTLIEALSSCCFLWSGGKWSIWVIQPPKESEHSLFLAASSARTKQRENIWGNLQLPYIETAEHSLVPDLVANLLALSLP